jgi:curved DNA-binding protein
MRAEYDQLRKYGGQQPGAEFHPPPDWEAATHYRSSDFHGPDADEFSDFFASVFGPSGSARRSYDANYRQSGMRMRGEDVRYRMALFLEDVFQGTEKNIEFQTPLVDQQGLISHQKRTLRVKIPAGSYNGQNIRLKGQGSPGIGGGAAGDLYLEVEIAPHPFYQVDGKDILLTLPIAPWEAAAGATVEVPTLGGKTRVRIPENAQTGQKLRLKGRGLPGKPAGDQYIVLQIVMPANSTRRSKQLFSELAQELAFNPRLKLGV